MNIEVGIFVEVERDQTKTRIGLPKYPGRRGVVVRQNSCGGDRHGGLWYVQLDATARSKAREETFWGNELHQLVPTEVARLSSDKRESNVATLTQDNYGIWRRDGEYITQWRVDDATRGCGAKRYCVQLVGADGKLLGQIFNGDPLVGGVRTFLKHERAQAEADKRNSVLLAN